MARWLLAQVTQKVLRKDARLREWFKRIKRRRGASIALGVENLSTWAHEFIHAADDRLGHLTENGQHWRAEAVAELGALDGSAAAAAAEWLDAARRRLDAQEALVTIVARLADRLAPADG